MAVDQRWIRSANRLTTPGWPAFVLPVIVVVGLVSLGAANVASRLAWHEVEDGVLWAVRSEGVVAADIAAGTPAEAVGLQRGDLLIAIDDRPVETLKDVVGALHAAQPGALLRYTVLRLGSRDVVDVRVAPVPGRPGALYYVLASVATFTLLVGGAVRLRRPRDPATLHFLWLAAAFFGVFTFSFSGRLDRLDWVFYWADAIAILALPPLFLDFTMVFPDRPRTSDQRLVNRALCVLIYAPAIVLGLTRVVAVARSSNDAQQFVRITEALDRLEFLYLAVCFIGGLLVLTRALGRATSTTERRQLKWIAWGTALGAGPFALGYALPYARGVEPSLTRELSAIPLSLIPLAYASAIVRYRLRDIEIILKRALIFATIVAVVVLMFVGLLEAAQRLFPSRVVGQDWVIAILGTLVALLLAPPVKDFVQTTLDRAFYKDRYDYRRALVGFARDLNTDLDPESLAQRLVSRVVETLVVDRMALLLDKDSNGVFAVVHQHGLGTLELMLTGQSDIGQRLEAGDAVTLDDPTAVARYAPEDIDAWREAGLFYFVPCVSKAGTTAVLALGLKHSTEPLSSEDMALLGAVASQIATALDNARLYRQLHVKAEELDRLHGFNENILESLEDGLLVADLDDRIVRWNGALERTQGVARDEAVGRPLEELRIVSCHLGAGASLCAIAGGRSVDTTMGFTPLEGLVMATRSGSVDPGLLIWLQRHQGITADELDEALEHRSGVAGLSGLSGDMRELLDAVDRGDERARLAYDVYIHRLRAQIAAMVAAAGGIDALVFTGGIGEHSRRVRDDARAGLTVVDGAQVLVIEAREDLELAAQAEAALRQ